jgi:hypothetical protein
MENIKDEKECFGNFAQQRIKSFATLRQNSLSQTSFIRKPFIRYCKKGMTIND